MPVIIVLQSVRIVTQSLAELQVAVYGDKLLPFFRPTVFPCVLLLCHLWPAELCYTVFSQDLHEIHIFFSDKNVNNEVLCLEGRLNDGATVHNNLIWIFLYFLLFSLCLLDSQDTFLKHVGSIRVHWFWGSWKLLQGKPMQHSVA